VDLYSLVNPARGGLAAGSARPGALSVGVAVDAAVQAHRHHRRCRLQLPARDFDVARTGIEGTVGGEGVGFPSSTPAFWAAHGDPASHGQRDRSGGD
jgi:hypothetical protein